jgi:hypothetical protein
MGAYKKLTSKDVIITPFEVNKSFNFTGLTSTFVDNEGIDGFVGRNYTSSFNSSSDPTSGNDNLFDRLVYHNIKQLYYGNYLSGSNGFISNASTASFNPDGTITGQVYTTNYNDYLESTIYVNDRVTGVGSGSYKYFPTEEDAYIAVLSIPTKLYGDYIVPGTFSYDIDSVDPLFLKDDGQGNVYIPGDFNISGNDEICGNIFYTQGIITITYNPTSIGLDFTFFSLFDKDTWTDERMFFTSSLTLHETQYKCTIRENEFNYSMNPTLLVSGGLDQVVNGKATYQDFATGSDFPPYITTVGLYDEDQNLLAVGKLAKPLPTSQTTDTTILINLDLN